MFEWLKELYEEWKRMAKMREESGRAYDSWEAGQGYFVSEFRDELGVFAELQWDDGDARFNPGLGCAEIFHLQGGAVIARINVRDCDGGRGRKATVTSSVTLAHDEMEGFREALEGATILFELDS